MHVYIYSYTPGLQNENSTLDDELYTIPPRMRMCTRKDVPIPFCTVHTSSDVVSVDACGQIHAFSKLIQTVTLGRGGRRMHKQYILAQTR